MSGAFSVKLPIHPHHGYPCQGTCNRVWEGDWNGEGDMGYRENGVEVRASMKDNRFCEVCIPCIM